jgi:hypothetical protein
MINMIETGDIIQWGTAYGFVINKTVDATTIKWFADGREHSYSTRYANQIRVISKNQTKDNKV